MSSIAFDCTQGHEAPRIPCHPSLRAFQVERVSLIARGVEEEEDSTLGDEDAVFWTAEEEEEKGSVLATLFAGTEVF